MNVFAFIAIAAVVSVFLVARGLAIRPLKGAPASTVVVVVSWLLYLVGRTVIVSTLDAAWLSYASAGTLLGILCIAPVSIKLGVVALRLWEVAFLCLLGAYLVAWSVSERTRSGIFLDPNTEGILLLLLSTPIWVRYATIVPIYIWGAYVCLLAATLSRSSALMAAGFLLAAILPRVLVRKEVVAPTLVFAALLIAAVTFFDPSQMPNADGPLRFLSLNDGSFYERRTLLFASISTMTTDLTSFFFGSSINAFFVTNGNSVHSAFAELFLSCGLIGGALFVSLFGKFVATYIDRRSIGLFFGYTLSAGFSVLLFNSVILLIFMFCFALVGRDPQKQNEWMPTTSSVPPVPQG